MIAKHKLEMQKLQDAADQKKISKESTILFHSGMGVKVLVVVLCLLGRGG